MIRYLFTIIAPTIIPIGKVPWIKTKMFRTKIENCINNVWQWNSYSKS